MVIGSFNKKKHGGKESRIEKEETTHLLIIRILGLVRRSFGTQELLLLVLAPNPVKYVAAQEVMKGLSAHSKKLLSNVFIKTKAFKVISKWRTPRSQEPVSGRATCTCPLPSCCPSGA
jgi:hypothetical protein